MAPSGADGDFGDDEGLVGGSLIDAVRLRARCNELESADGVGVYGEWGPAPASVSGAHPSGLNAGCPQNQEEGPYVIEM